MSGVQCLSILSGNNHSSHGLRENLPMPWAIFSMSIPRTSLLPLQVLRQFIPGSHSLLILPEQGHLLPRQGSQALGQLSGQLRRTFSAHFSPTRAAHKAFHEKTLPFLIELPLRLLVLCLCYWNLSAATSLCLLD